MDLIKPIYRCPICGIEYSTEQDVVACRDRMEPEEFTPGTIVSIRLGYHWFDGNPDWVVGDDKSPDIVPGRDALSFLFVITSSHRHPHNPHGRAYSVRTLALENGFTGGVRGWTTPRTHYQMHAVALDMIPQTVWEQSARFIGEKYANLLP